MNIRHPDAIRAAEKAKMEKWMAERAAQEARKSQAADELAVLEEKDRQDAIANTPAPGLPDVPYSALNGNPYVMGDSVPSQAPKSSANSVSNEIMAEIGRMALEKEQKARQMASEAQMSSEQPQR